MSYQPLFQCPLRLFCVLPPKQYQDHALSSRNKTLFFNTHCFTKYVGNRKQSLHNTHLSSPKEKTVHTFKRKAPATFHLYPSLGTWSNVLNTFHLFREHLILKLLPILALGFCPGCDFRPRCHPLWYPLKSHKGCWWWDVPRQYQESSHSCRAPRKDINIRKMHPSLSAEEKFMFFLRGSCLKWASCFCRVFFSKGDTWIFTF